MTAAERKEALAAEWIAAGRPSSGPLREALTVAVIAAAAEKRASKPQVPAPDLGRIAKIEEERRKAFRREQAVLRAVKMYDAAHEWPRCGEGWPAGRAEEAADDLLREEGRRLKARG